MNKILLILLFMVANLSAQNKKGYLPDENDSLYIKAIKEFIVYHNEFKDRFILPNKNEKNLYIAWNRQLIDLPKSIDGFNIIHIRPFERKKIYKANKKRIVTLNVTSLTLKKNRFYIDIKEIETFYKKGKVEWSQIGMWTTSYFKMVNDEMIFEETKVGGLTMPRNK